MNQAQDFKIAELSSRLQSLPVTYPRRPGALNEGEKYILESCRLGSDYVPSSSEIAQANLVLAEERQGLENCREQIDILEDILDIYYANKKQYKKNIFVCRSTISPIRRLPFEILELIFPIVCSFQRHSLIVTRRERGFIRVHAPPVDLSGVCRRWRETVRGCPQLWASIDFSLNAFSKASVYVLNLFLERAGDKPLDILLRKLDEYYFSSLHEREDGWKTLVCNLDRCSILTLENGGHCVGCGTDQALGVPLQDVLTFPNLTTFVANYGSRHHREIIHSAICRALTRAPKLTSAYMSISDLVFQLPYSQLTSLTFHHELYNEKIMEVLGALSCCLELDYLAFHVLSLSRTAPIEATIVNLPKLRALVLGDPDYHPVMPDHADAAYNLMFRTLSLPSLKSLDLGYRTVIADDWPIDMLSFLERCANSLTELSIADSQFEDDPWEPALLTPLLERVPNLQALDFFYKSSAPAELTCNTTMIVDLFSSLARLSSPLVPQLSSLQIRISHLDHDPIGFMHSILRTAELRCSDNWDGQNGAQLKNIHFTYLRTSNVGYSPYIAANPGTGDLDWKPGREGIVNEEVEFLDAVLRRMDMLRNVGVEVIVKQIFYPRNQTYAL